MANKDLENRLRQKVDQAARDSQQAYRDKVKSLHDGIDKIKGIGNSLDKFGKAMAKIADDREKKASETSQAKPKN